VAWVTLGIGSNTDPVDNLHSCLDALLLQFRDMKLSSVFESAAAGNASTGTYLNMAVGFETDLKLDELAAFLKKLEAKHSRVRDAGNGHKVTLDIDILTYGKLSGNQAGITLPRQEILNTPYVLWPLSQVASQQRHPESSETYATLWKNFTGDRSSIHPVDFEWHGRKLSSAR
jgi:2-amino-4-hydroxy-6-hydroxymethyldihydropteridine diphosphokinase